MRTTFKNITILIIVLLFFNTVKADVWLSSLDEAKKVALASNKLILVDFWATWCGPCKRMDKESWDKEDVQQLMDHYVPVKIDIDRNKSLAQNYGVKGIPFIFILDANGKVLYQQMSYRSKGEVMSLLKKYALTTAYLQQDLLNYFSNDSFASAIRLASKYQDYSLLIGDLIVKQDILNVSKAYLDESKKMLRTLDLTNKDAFFQKIDLFEIQEYLILNKTKQALRRLEKIKVDSLDNINVSLYNFLNYVMYSQLKDKEHLQLWKAKLSEDDITKGLLFTK